MSDLFRETAFGKLVHYLSKGKLLQYPEERDGFVVPEQYIPGYKPQLDDGATLVLAGDDLEADRKSVV